MSEICYFEYIYDYKCLPLTFTYMLGGMANQQLGSGSSGFWVCPGFSSVSPRSVAGGGSPGGLA